MFGDMPSYAFFIRHAQDIAMDHMKIDYTGPEARPAFVLEDVQDVRFDHLNLRRGTAAAPLFDLRDVTDFAVENSRGSVTPGCPAQSRAKSYDENPRPIGVIHTENGPVLQTVCWRRDALVAFPTDVRDEGAASP